jgi:hypothetical protein
VGVGWYVAQESESGERHLAHISPQEAENAYQPTLRLWSQKGEQDPVSYLFSADLFRGKGVTQTIKCLECVSLLAETVDTARIGNLWDRVAGSELEQEILAALRIIIPEVECLSIPGDAEGRVRPGGVALERIPCVQLKGVSEPMPIRSLGHGMTRVLAIVLALANARDGFLLVDQMENNLHLAVQADLWRLIFRLSRQLNAQVFATTHSWDCFEAFQQAAGEYEQYEDALLILLRRGEDGIVSSLFEGEELATVPREQVQI